MKRLLQDVSLDVSTEIDTLETMLRQDGLTHDFRQDFGGRKDERINCGSIRSEPL